MGDEQQAADHEDATERRRAERVANIVAFVALASCLGVLFASCGGDDIIVGGMLPPTTAGAATPTRTP